MRILIGVAWALCLSGCCLSAYTNKPLPPSPPAPSHASFDIRDKRGNDDVLLLLALSGGGSRAAYLSASAMLKLQNVFEEIDILKEVDLISSVSGGSLPAAYYAVSRDPEGVTVKVPELPGCTGLTESVKSENLFCHEKKRLIGVKKPMTAEEKEALKRALPQQEQKIERLYSLSRQEVRSNREWDEETVKKLMSHDYLGRWIANWFWPSNVFRYWFTAYDRSDIMAQTFEDSLYDVYPFGGELKFQDLNPERPYLIINATDGTEDVPGENCLGKPVKHFGELFTFTDEDFVGKLNSDISSYSVARAVMGSAAFPGAFNYMTLRNFCDPKAEKRYIDVFDGGNADNLGLESVKKVILEAERKGGKYKQYVVILIDAYKEHQGIDRNNCDPRSLFSYVVDLNFFDTFDALLEDKRDDMLWQFRNRLFDVDEGEPVKVENLTFWHITFEDIAPEITDDACPDPMDPEKSIPLRKALNRIPTSFSISDHDTACIDRAVDILVSSDNATLNRIREILLANPPAGSGGLHP